MISLPTLEEGAACYLAILVCQRLKVFAPKGIPSHTHESTASQESFAQIPAYSALYKAKQGVFQVFLTCLSRLQGLHQDVAHWLRYIKGVWSRALYWGLSFHFKMQMAGSEFPSGI